METDFKSRLEMAQETDLIKKLKFTFYLGMSKSTISNTLKKTLVTIANNNSKQL